MRDHDPEVFHLITRLLRGGAEAKTIEVMRGLDGYSFTLGHGAAYDGRQRARLASMGIRTVRFRTLRHYNPFTALPAVVSIADHLRRNRYDLVHTHSTEAGIIGRLAARLAGVRPVVHTVHGIPFAEDRNPLLNRFVLACERRVAPDTDRIITNADRIASEYLDLGIGRSDQYRTVYSGVDLERFDSAEPAGDLPGGRPRITMVARLVDGKGVHVLLDALEALETDGISVCIVGEGPQYQEYAGEIEARGMSDRVSLVGFRDDVPAVLAASDVFVLPSYREGTPRVITEAMASGLPVVATDIAGIPEQVEDGTNGYLVPPGDSAALADRLDRLLSDPRKRQRFGRNGRHRARRFAASTMIDEIDDVYLELLE